MHYAPYCSVAEKHVDDAVYCCLRLIKYLPPRSSQFNLVMSGKRHNSTSTGMKL